MKIKDLYDKGNFPLVKLTVTKWLSNLVEEFDPCMQCNLVNIEKDLYDKEVYILHLDFLPYEKFNKTVAIPSFWDDNGKPTLTWFESKFYNNGRTQVYVMGTNSFEEFFEKKTVEDLRNEFSPYQLDWMSRDGLGNLVYPKGYVEFLENKILGDQNETRSICN